MMEFTEVFELSEVYEKLPREHVFIPTECMQRLIKKSFFDMDVKNFLDNIQFAGMLKFKDCSLRVVGQNGNVVLISRYGYNPEVDSVVTFIDSYHFKKFQLQTLYKHSELSSCISCSMSSNGALLAVTMKKTFLKKQPTPENANSMPNLFSNPSRFLSALSMAKPSPSSNTKPEAPPPLPPPPPTRNPYNRSGPSSPKRGTWGSQEAHFIDEYQSILIEIKKEPKIVPLKTSTEPHYLAFSGSFSPSTKDFNEALCLIIRSAPFFSTPLDSQSPMTQTPTPRTPTIKRMIYISSSTNTPSPSLSPLSTVSTDSESNDFPAESRMKSRLPDGAILEEQEEDEIILSPKSEKTISMIQNDEKTNGTIPNHYRNRPLPPTPSKKPFLVKQVGNGFDTVKPVLNHSQEEGMDIVNKLDTMPTQVPTIPNEGYLSREDFTESDTSSEELLSRDNIFRSISFSKLNLDNYATNPLDIMDGYILTYNHFYIYEIQCKQTPGSGIIKIHSVQEPKLLADHILWFHHDPIKKYIYVLRRSKIASEKRLDILKCYSFKGKKERVVYECTIPKINEGDVITFVQLSRDEEFNFVLCRRHYAEALADVTKISLYFCSYRRVVEFTVPNDNQNIFFDCLGDNLVIFIPNQYFRLVHCSLYDDIKLGLCLEGSKFVNSLPKCFEPKLRKFWFESFGDLETSFKYSGLIDTNSGGIYRYKFSKQTILNILSAEPKWSAHLLNLAALHFQDHSFINLILETTVSKGKPDWTTTDLFKEFLLTYSFTQYPNPLGSLAKQFSLFLPRTTLTGSELDKNDSSHSTVPTENAGVRFFRFSYNNTSQPILPNYNRFKLDLKLLPQKNIKSMETKEVAKPPNIRSFFGLFTEDPSKFLSVATENTKKKAKDREVQIDAPDPYKDYVSDALFAHVSNNMKEAMSGEIVKQLVNEYRKTQKAQSDHIYKVICEFAPKSEPALFDIFLHLYSAIEEVLFPFPDHFKDHMTSIGFHCLRRNEFLQYVERGVFKISKEFIINIKNLTQDSHLYQVLISKLPEDELLSLKVELKEDDDYIDYLLDCTLQKFHPKEVDMDYIDIEHFLPLSIYMSSIDNAKKEFSYTQSIWLRQVISSVDPTLSNPNQ